MANERVEQVAAPDGGTFDAFVAAPDGGGPGVLLIQEIFGVGEFIEGTARKLAGEGFSVLAPDVFWRVQPRWQGDRGDLQESMAVAQRYGTEVPPDVQRADLHAALAHLRGLPEVGGRKVAAMGYCFGGTMSFLVACTADVDALVSYYGSGVAGLLDQVGDGLRCPTLFHFGDSDPFLPNDDVAKVQARYAGRDDVQVEVHPGAGHAFENWTAEMFSNPSAAATSWPMTVGFLRTHLA